MPLYRGSIIDGVSFLSNAVSEEKSVHVVFAYSHSTVIYSEDVVFRDAVESAELVLADGKPFIWVSQLIGKPIKEKSSGSDFMLEFLRECAKKGFGVFLLGASEEVLGRLKKSFEKNYPHLTVAGLYSPPFGEWTREEDERILSMVNKSGAKILLVGISTPKQDIWIHENKSNLKVNVSLCVGAAFDYASGVKKRAPKWMQDAGLEWFYRLIHEPARMWRRYILGGPIFLWLIVKGILKNS